MHLIHSFGNQSYNFINFYWNWKSTIFAYGGRDNSVDLWSTCHEHVVTPVQVPLASPEIMSIAPL